jgi:hypothetical protein
VNALASLGGVGGEPERVAVADTSAAVSVFGIDVAPPH